ncbi:recombinase family protein [Streptomyces sp. NPDC088733]|uniref:recombinase family protein n=1 Tax=Streptomyces sp. NPDC088733 TaxID=3365880 RepID=UPI00381BBE1E
MLTDETTSPERQRAANRAAAVSLGIDLGDREAVDLGVSASKTTPFQRPELGPWLTERTDEFDALVCWRFDRLVRSMADMNVLVEWARVHRKMIVFAEGPGGRLVLDFRNGVDLITQLILQIFAFAAEFEAQSIRERVTSAQAAMRVMPLRWRGSRPPYGYMPAPLEGGGWTLVQDPETVPVIERIIRELVDGKSAAAIATALNDDCIPSPRDYWSLRQGRETGGKTGGKAGETVTRGRFAWRHGTVKGVLTSERILGWKTTGDRPVRDSEGAPVMATAEPILTREEFDAVGALFAELSVDNNGAERVDTVSLLLRVIMCAGCGERMYLQRAGGTETYKCGSFTRGHSCEARATVKREWADDFAEREFLRAAGSLRLTRTKTIPGYSPQAEIAATTAEYEAHMSEQGRQKSNSARAAWQKRADALDTRLAELEAREATEPRTEVVHVGRTFADEWKAADTAGRRAMLVDAGARLIVVKAKRGKYLRLDESRVRFELRHEFYSGAADVMRDLASDLEAEALTAV